MAKDLPKVEKDLKPMSRDRLTYKSYDQEINEAKAARNHQWLDTDPRIEKEGFLGVDDLDKMRRRKVR